MSTLAEIFGNMLCYANEKFKKKYVIMVFMGLASLACLFVALIPQGEKFQSGKILVVFFAFLGKTVATGAFNSSYIYTSMMFPSIIRSTMFMFVSSIGKIGSIISPQINLLGDLIWKPLPYLIFSCSSFLGLLFFSTLPDPFEK